MSIGILIKVHDGIVLAADSASTLSLLQADQTSALPVVVNVYNNANKIANLYKGQPIGCVAFGSGSIGSASISTLLKDFRKRLAASDTDFRVGAYTMGDVAKRLSDFLADHVAGLGPKEPKPTIGIFVAGYSADKGLGEAWQVSLDKGNTQEPTILRSEDDVGISWGGEGESIARLVLGFSPHLPTTLASIIRPEPQKEAIQQLSNALRAKLQAPLVFAPMPIQDVIDLAEWLVHTASMFSRFTPGASSVGGPIESAAITRHEGFKWIRRKHYYEQAYNPEVPDGGPYDRIRSNPTSN